MLTEGLKMLIGPDSFSVSGIVDSSVKLCGLVTIFIYAEWRHMGRIIRSLSSVIKASGSTKGLHEENPLCAK